MNRQIRRLERVVDELMKINDDGKGSERTQQMLDLAQLDTIRRECEDEE